MVQTKLPHSIPFIMVDRVIAVEDGLARGVKTITEEILTPSGTLPQSLLIEALAQISGFAAGQQEGTKALFAGIKDMTFEGKVHRGDVLLLESRLLGRFGPLYSFEASAIVSDTLVARGTIYLNLYD